MKNRAVRALLVLLALAAQAGAGYMVWQLDGQMAAAERDRAAFDNQAQQLAVDLVYLGAAQRAYVADGQDAQAWIGKASDLSSSVNRRLGDTRKSARSPEAQTALDGAAGALGAFAQADIRAREYLADATQRISASDVIFTDGAAQLVKAEASIDEARVRESAARTAETASLRQMQLSYIGGAAAVTLLVLLLLLPIPRSTAATDEEVQEQASGGLGLGHVARQGGGADEAGSASIAPAGVETLPAGAQAPAAGSPGVADVADICASLARVREPKELPPLLERVGNILDAAGLIIWMPDGPKGALRPVLAHGYQPLAITRMGTIALDADNATALAFRTRSQHVVPPEAGSNAAVVSPLVTSDGCSGVMALEFKPGVDASDHLRALAAIVSAQLATLISPAGEGGAAGPAV
jgi:hypothetical protein